MKKKILILAGGYSKERQISLLTGKEVNNAVKKKYKTYMLDPKGNLVDTLRKIKPDIVFNALHGRYGEDGYIQSILEIEKIKYTHSGILSSFLAIDKQLSKKIFKKNRILTPKSFILQNKYFDKKKFIFNKINSQFGFPAVIKPINEGSSVGVFICNKNNILNYLKKLNFYDEIMVEQYIPGREIQSAIMGNNKLGLLN